MRALERLKNGQGGVVSVLDVGSQKITSIIARYTPYLESETYQDRVPDMTVLGIGIQASAGVKSGVIIDLEAAESAIRVAVNDAERMAGQTIDEVVVPVSCGRLRSINFEANERINGRAVTDKNIEKMLSAFY